MDTAVTHEFDDGKGVRDVVSSKVQSTHSSVFMP